MLDTLSNAEQGCEGGLGFQGFIWTDFVRLFLRVAVRFGLVIYGCHGVLPALPLVTSLPVLEMGLCSYT